MLFPLTLAFGGLIGFALGLTGGGGSLLAVPLLVYGLALDPRQAIVVSLAAVGAIALTGVISRLRTGEVEIGTGLMFAASGMLGAPAGVAAANAIPESFLLVLFSVLMLAVAMRMWLKSRGIQKLSEPGGGESVKMDRACERSDSGKLKLTSRCAVLLLAVGLLTGFLSGMFGVGGGFIIVPALVLFSRMPIHKAISTSLLVIFLVSVAGVAAHHTAGRDIPIELTTLFVAGGLAGVLLGGKAGKRLSGPALQKVFALGIVAVAIFVVTKSVIF